MAPMAGTATAETASLFHGWHETSADASVRTCRWNVGDVVLGQPV